MLSTYGASSYWPEDPPRAKSSRVPSEHQGGEWAKIPTEIFQDLIVLMPKRCRQVINIGGGRFSTECGRWGLKRPLFLLFSLFSVMFRCMLVRHTCDDMGYFGLGGSSDYVVVVDRRLGLYLSILAQVQQVKNGIFQ
jgi:hypothetical protein